MKSLADFVTSVAGAITALVGLGTAVVAIAVSRGDDTPPQPTPAATASAQPTPTPSPSPTPTPSPSPTPTPSPEPTVSAALLTSLSQICETLADETDTRGAQYALPRAVDALQQLEPEAQGETRRDILRSANDLERAAVLFEGGADATPAVISAVDRLASLGAESCQR